MIFSINVNIKKLSEKAYLAQFFKVRSVKQVAIDPAQS